jgi:hypothetical protein
MRNFLKISSIVVCGALCGACGTSPELGAQNSAPVASALQGPASKYEVAGWMSGTFSSLKQAGKDADFKNVAVRSCGVTVTNLPEDMADRVFVYQSHFVFGERPYLHRVAAISDRAPDGVELDFFTIGNEAAFVDLCDQAAPTVDWKDLGEMRCTHPLVKTGGHYVGEARCSSTMSDYALHTAMIKDQGYTIWSRGYDADGKKVWGAKSAYSFERDDFTTAPAVKYASCPER